MSGKDDISLFDNTGKRPLPEGMLMAYLEGKLSAAEQHEVEQWLAEEGMESDALEGLGMLRPDEARHTVSKLNHKLRKELAGKKRKRRALKADQFTWIAVCIILLLVVTGYIIIRMRLKQ
jgi:hypothetical protein